MSATTPESGSDDEPDEDDCSSEADMLLRAVAAAPDAPPPLLPEELIGQQVGRFRVVSLIGRGGMGIVYAAEDPERRHEVALKVLSPESAGDQARRRRFLREARAAAAIDHPCVAAVHEVGEAGGRVYIAMEKAPGESLRALLALDPARPLAVPRAVGIARQIAAALTAAHDAGVIHRDLKPDNVLVAPGDRVKVVDFGLAKYKAGGALGLARAAFSADALTQEGGVVGTPGYMSPEQAMGSAVDERTDVFALGVILYEMLTGLRPFRAATPSKLLVALHNERPAAPESHNPVVGAALSRLVLRCLVREPAARFASCRDLGLALEAASPTPLARRVTDLFVRAFSRRR